MLSLVIKKYPQSRFPTLGVRIISQNIEYLLIFLLPVVTILICLSYEINFIFYSKSNLGGFFLQINLSQCLIMAISIDFLTLLQALRYSKKAMIYMSIGLLIKLLLQFPLVYFFQGQGAVLATDIAFAYICIASYRKLSSIFGIRLKYYCPVILINLIFCVVSLLSYQLSTRLFTVSTKTEAFVFAAIFGSILLIIYIVILDFTDVTYKNFGRHFILKKYIAKH